MNIPQIQIRQEYGRIGINADNGTQEIEQPRPTVEMQQRSAKQTITRNRRGLEIDQERAWDALALGNNLKVMSKIYSMGKDIALKGIARRISEGKQLGDLTRGGNAIADISKDWRERFPEFDFRGPASSLNVDLSYTQDELNIDVERGGVDIDVQVNRPVHRYERGKLDIYMQQWPSINITVDLTA
ncbi:DUF6470 family protein [Paenibacillus sp. SYP-B4298]|uniref:DUF6470 family protein n=1 Tax=Paenibacillus sp. SYP-B4298 TaxID=2996034 RepID=UPI0022DD4A95|nr:DUF6470 family protein [Paenibacillus sp. SYP-B4298]